MAHAHFTARWAAAVPAPPPGQVDYFDQTLPSLGLRVAPSGRKTWFVMYRVSGRLRRYTLGTYPAVSLADARQRATDARHSVAHGGDPPMQRQADPARPHGGRAGDAVPRPLRHSPEEELARRRALPRHRGPAGMGPASRRRRASAGRRRSPGPDRRAWAPIAANRVLALVGSSPYRGYSYGRCLPRCLVLSASIMF